ncbi:MAG: class I SAM-dependent methyltransferase [Calditrichaeota bacterium]|nr:class I SAM-dependent methyltransferase [Calditrichota bacterium]
MPDPYQNIAKFYDALTGPFNKALRSIGFRLSSPKKGMRVLEVGCGTGANLKLYRQAGCRVYGIDLSPSMIAVAQKKLENNAHLVTGDAALMPFTDDHFDLVIAMLTLHEIGESHRLPIVKEMVRVKKPDGRLLFVDYRAGSIRFPKGWFYRAVILFFEKAAGRRHFENYRNFLSREGLYPLLKKSDLIVEKEKTVAYGNLSLMLCRSNNTK